MSEPAATLQRSYRSDATTLAQARRDVLAWLGDAGADQPTLDRAALIVSELATNALQASPGSHYHVQITRLDAEQATISVRNSTKGSLPPSPGKWRPVDHSALRGRGLAIVDSLSDGVTVTTDGDQVVVTARIRLP